MTSRTCTASSRANGTTTWRRSGGRISSCGCSSKCWPKFSSSSARTAITGRSRSRPWPSTWVHVKNVTLFRFSLVSDLENVMQSCIWSDEFQRWKLPEVTFFRTRLPPAGQSSNYESRWFFNGKILIELTYCFRKRYQLGDAQQLRNGHRVRRRDQWRPFVAGNSSLNHLKLNASLN